MFKTDPARAACVVRTALHLVRLYAVLSSPILPEACDKVLAAFGDFPGSRDWPGEDIGAELCRMPPGLAFRVPDLLFRKLADAEVAEWRERFAGASVEAGHATLHKGG
jgi:methionyl-tRNA synthetase